MLFGSLNFVSTTHALIKLILHSEDEKLVKWPGTSFKLRRHRIYTLKTVLTKVDLHNTELAEGTCLFFHIP